RGSARLDLATSQPIYLENCKPVAVATGVYGPVGNGCHALLLGRSSNTMQGLFILPGVIDSDYTGEIKIMLWTPQPSYFITSGVKLAQLIPFKDSLDTEMPASRGERGNQGFGSTGNPEIYWTQHIVSSCPMLRCMVTKGRDQAIINGLIDTGTDITIVA
ncbi:POK9 protein, partial [Lophotis ruficrista]|nr:POK9 protein [Lophotis ruficrista]